MTGDATFSGTTYQAKVIALVYVHILAQMRLGWLSPADDTPIAVSGETGGPGDDAKLEFGTTHPAAELQAKHGLTAGKKFQETVGGIASRSDPYDESRVIIAVDRASSRKLYGQVATDLERIRTGRLDSLREEVTALLEGGFDKTLLRRLSVVPLDLDVAGAPESKQAIHLLQSTLEDRDQASLAWSVLVADAGDLCAGKFRRTRKDLVDLLNGRGIKVKPLHQDDRWHRQLDFTKALLEKRHPEAALAVLTQIDTDMGTLQVDPFVRYRIAQQKANAFLQLDRYKESILQSQRALDIDPQGVHALVSLALATMLNGDVETASSAADRAVAFHPRDPTAWSIRAQVSATSGTEGPDPPEEVRSSSQFRSSLAQIAVKQDDWGRVLEITSALLADGMRTPEILFYRANALISINDELISMTLRQRHEEVERLTSEILDVVADESQALTHKALILRSSARRLLNRISEADADLSHAHDLARNDPDAIGHKARLAMDAGRDDEALALLQHPIVDETPLLLALRAQLLAQKDDDMAAEKDLEKSVSIVADAHDPDLVRFATADVALMLRKTDRAEQILVGTTAKGKADARFSALHARIAFDRSKIDEGKRLYRQAAETDPSHRGDYFAELGARLLSEGQVEDAVKAFDQVSFGEIPTGGLKYFGAALFRANDLPRAQAIVDTLASQGSLPLWAHGIAIDIAMRQENSRAAISHLESLLKKGSKTSGLRLELARRLLMEERKSEAVNLIDELVREESLPARERIYLAQLLKEIDRTVEALSHAFRAFRESPQDPAIHRAFIMLAMTSDEKPGSTEVSGADTHILLTNKEGDTKQYTIYSSPPIDPLRAEIGLSDADAAGLVGKARGELWRDEWRVTEILPAIVYAVQDAMLHYEDRFPSEPFFLTSMKVGDGTSVKDFAPIIGSLEARKEHVRECIRIYREKTLPLGALSHMVSGSISELMDSAIYDPKEFGSLAVEWSDRDGWLESQSAARDANEVVLTRSALKAATDLGLLEQLAATYSLVVPQSLIEGLKQDIVDAERTVSKGQTTMFSGGAGLQLQEVKPHDPLLLRSLESKQRLLEWVEQNTTSVPRPLETIKPIGSRDEEARDFMGPDSYDAMSLVHSRSATLYADDLGLRRFIPKGSTGRSFSTVGLLLALAEKALLSPSERDEKLLALIARGYVFLRPSRELILHALRNQTLGHSAVMKVFELVAGPGMTPAEAGRILAQVLKSEAIAAIRVYSLEALAVMGLTAMATTWPLPLCVQIFLRAANDEFTLMPQSLDEIRQACSTFVRNSVSKPIG